MCDSLPGQRPSAESDPDQQGVKLCSLTLYHRHYSCYWLEGPAGACGPRGSVLISTSLVFTGGHFAGVRLANEHHLLIIFVREDGAVFQCRYGSHNPRRVLSILPRRLVRLRLFASDFCWSPFGTLSPEGLGSGAKVAIGVTDDQGERHYFSFQVDTSIRGHFPSAPRR